MPATAEGRACWAGEAGGRCPAPGPAPCSILHGFSGFCDQEAMASVRRGGGGGCCPLRLPGPLGGVTDTHYWKRLPWGRALGGRCPPTQVSVTLVSGRLGMWALRGGPWARPWTCSDGKSCAATTAPSDGSAPGLPAPGGCLSRGLSALVRVSGVPHASRLLAEAPDHGSQNQGEVTRTSQASEPCRAGDPGAGIIWLRMDRASPGHPGDSCGPTTDWGFFLPWEAWPPRPRGRKWEGRPLSLGSHGHPPPGPLA